MLVFFKRFKSILSVFLVVLIVTLCDSQDVLSLDYQECAVDTDSEQSVKVLHTEFQTLKNDVDAQTAKLQENDVEFKRNNSVLTEQLSQLQENDSKISLNITELSKTISLLEKKAVETEEKMKELESTLKANYENECDCNSPSGAKQLQYFRNIQNISVEHAYGTDLFTVNGSLFMAVCSLSGQNSDSTLSFIYKYYEDIHSFQFFQNITTMESTSVRSFKIGNDWFIIFTSSLMEVNATSGMGSMLMKYNSRMFVPYQLLYATDAAYLEFFEIDNENETESFLCIISYYSETSYDIESQLFKWDKEKELFNLHQGIATFGATYAKHFTHNREHFLVVANTFSDNEGYQINSSVLKWTGSMFIHYQSLPIGGAAAVDVLVTPRGTAFAALGSRFLDNSKQSDIHIYQFNKQSEFELFQTLTGSKISAICSFLKDGEYFFIVTNTMSDVHKTVVYMPQFMQFVKFQELNSDNLISSCDTVEYRGVTYLALSFYDQGTAAIYQWTVL